MATNPYRTPAQTGRELTPSQASRPLDLAHVALFAWVVTLVRIAVGLAHAEPPGRELVFAWLILLLAPVLLAKELCPRSRG